MRCKIPEISWHNRDPVLSVDIQPKREKSAMYRLASGGTDSHVLIWSLVFTETGEVHVDVAADLTRHQRAVNVVKWSPNGKFLASGDDESVVFIWKQKEENEPVNILDSVNEQDKEVWITLKVLRGHMEDVYDLSWSPDSQFLVSGSVDNTAIIWDVQKGKVKSILNDHKGFVQGVAWDPKNQYVATLSTDRFLRIFDIQTKKVVHRVSKTLLPVPKEHDLFEKKVRLYHDDTLQTFFRRLCFSPDGILLFTPSGVIDYDGVTQLVHATYIYSRYSLKQPAIILPSPDQYTVAVKCCPILFKLRYKTDASLTAVPLPYRMVFAIATKSSVYLYDTQQKVPLGLISNIHYTRLTDLTWSSDGKVLIVSSTDGFCSLITFEDGELGEEYTEINNETEGKDDKLTEKPHSSKNVSDNPLITGGFHQSNEKLQCDVIIDKDIISFDEKFKSPEKKCHSATPINIRRHPRRLSKDVKTVNISESLSPNSASKPNSPKFQQACVKTECEKPTISSLPKKETYIDEEAMDGMENMDCKRKRLDENVKLINDELETSTCCTEDIRLVYEDTTDTVSKDIAKVDVCEKNQVSQGTPEQKTPRRVQLKTISTPKSKKQLLK